MKIKQLSIFNYRSIQEVEDITFESIQALIGENNAGKSNILSAIQCFLSSGANANAGDFGDTDEKIIIKITFRDLSEKSKNDWQSYLIGGELILEKHIHFDSDKGSAKAEFHGYRAEPKNWFLSLEKIGEEKGARPKWIEIIAENGLPEYFYESAGKCGKAHFRKSLTKYTTENEIEYDEPNLSETQALGLSSVAISKLPKFYLLKAITDYSSEIKKNSSNTTFRLLMGDLSERILKKDPKYKKITEALDTISSLLNVSEEAAQEGEEKPERLSALGLIETKIKELLNNLMPGIRGVKLKVETEDIKSIFSRGVQISVDDGVETDVLLKGHGLQRCIVFSLLQTLIYNERNQFVEDEADNDFPIILAIEEPELYIHPQIRKLFYDVLLDFSTTDQVIFSTHSTQFVDIPKYQNIAIVKKTYEHGTKIYNCDLSVFNDIEDNEIELYQMFQKFTPEVNELFFADNILIVEGIQDKIAVTATLKKQGKIRNRTEEKNFSVIAVGSKDNIPSVARLLNSFNLNYVVLFDTDLYEGQNVDQINTANKSTNKIKAIVHEKRIIVFPGKLEHACGVGLKHFKKTYDTYKYFDNFENIKQPLVDIIDECMTKLFEPEDVTPVVVVSVENTVV